MNRFRLLWLIGFSWYFCTQTFAVESRQLLANEFVTVYESPDPKSIYCYTPGLTRLPSGRLIATMDLGGKGVKKLVNTVAAPNGKSLALRGKLFTSDDRGRTWTHRVDFPFGHARPFVAGNELYVLGQSGDLMVIRSLDEGVTWSEASALTQGEHWHQSACNVHYANGYVYLVMEKKVDRKIDAWPVSVLAPVLMRGQMSDDLTRREHWTFASELVFEDAVDFQELDCFGVPFFSMVPRATKEIVPRYKMTPIGWLETNVVQIVDPDHYWFDPQGKTFHLFMRAHTGGTGLAAMCKVVEQSDGSMATMLETAPSGRKHVYLPMPGGQMRFHLLYDELSKLYWLLSSQATDSMTRAERLPADRYNLPNNERHRLQLHFSKNCVDWCFAGLVARGETARESRHYASMIVDGDDLHILSRSGDHRAKSAHDGNLITFHTVKDFRKLVY
ncbi:MAG: exo-alpha-sialidase [Planctomycetales bacterium]|nr:exo-alpha-sialidase [Planctomycetales bacterium]